MGHAYSSISADVIARYKRLEGYDVKFLTGTDEHGQKIQKSAIKENLSPIDFCNKISKVFLDLTKQLNLSNTDFIRTTETRHVETVQKQNTIHYILTNIFCYFFPKFSKVSVQFQHVLFQLF